MTRPNVLFTGWIGPTTAIFPRSHFLAIVLPDKFGWAAVTKVQPQQLRVSPAASRLAKLFGFTKLISNGKIVRNVV